MFFHVNTNTVAEAGLEEEGAKIKDYAFKVQLHFQGYIHQNIYIILLENCVVFNHCLNNHSII